MDKLKHIAAISGLALLVLLFSCHRKNPADNKTTPPEQVAVKKDSVKTEEPKTEGYYIARKFKKATVIDMRELDGCQFMLQLDSTHRLEPTNLAEEFKKNKLPVWIKYIEEKDLASICQAG